MKILGIIPARGGSKGVKRKNIKDLCGKPLIHYTIDAANLSSTELDLVVSTDDLEIAEVCRDYGVEVMMRNSNLAEDKTPMPPVVLDILTRLEKQKRSYDAILLLQPTCPFRPAGLIDEAINLLSSDDIDSVISVSDVGDNHPARMYEIRKSQLLPQNDEFESLNRQDLPKIYKRNGLIYAIKTDVFKENMTFFNKKSTPVIVEPLYSVNIDEIWDFYLAEALLTQSAVVI